MLVAGKVVSIYIYSVYHYLFLLFSYVNFKLNQINSLEREKNIGLTNKEVEE